MVREKKSSPYQKMYLVTPIIYEKLKKCISSSDICDMDTLNKKHIPGKKDKSDSLIQQMAVREMRPSYSGSISDKTNLQKHGENIFSRKKWDVFPNYELKEEENLNDINKPKSEFDTKNEDVYFDDDFDMNLDNTMNTENLEESISSYKLPENNFNPANYQLFQPELDTFSDESDSEIVEQLKAIPSTSKSVIFKKPHKNLSVKRLQHQVKRPKVLVDFKPKKKTSRTVGFQTDEIPEIQTPKPKESTDKYVQTDTVNQYYRSQPALKTKIMKKPTSLIVRQPRDITISNIRDRTESNINKHKLLKKRKSTNLVKKKKFNLSRTSTQSTDPMTSSSRTSTGPVITEIETSDDEEIRAIENTQDGPKSITNEVKKLKSITYEKNPSDIKRIENVWQKFTPIQSLNRIPDVLKLKHVPSSTTSKLDSGNNQTLKSLTNDTNDIKALTYESSNVNPSLISENLPLRESKKIENKWIKFSSARKGKKDDLFFQCQICNKSFSKKFGLDRHMKSFHTESKELELPPEEQKLELYQPTSNLNQFINDEFQTEGDNENMHHSDLNLSTKRLKKIQLSRPKKYLKTDSDIPKHKKKKFDTWDLSSVTRT